MTCEHAALVLSRFTRASDAERVALFRHFGSCAGCLDELRHRVKRCEETADPLRIAGALAVGDRIGRRLVRRAEFDEELDL